MMRMHNVTGASHSAYCEVVALLCVLEAHFAPPRYCLYKQYTIYNQKNQETNKKIAAAVQRRAAIFFMRKTQKSKVKSLRC